MYERYCKIRDAKGLKDGTVAAMAGIGRSTFSDWKSGRSVPKDEKLEKIAAALDVSLTFLKTGKINDDGMKIIPEDLEILDMIHKLNEEQRRVVVAFLHSLTD